MLFFIAAFFGKFYMVASSVSGAPWWSGCEYCMIQEGVCAGG